MSTTGEIRSARVLPPLVAASIGAIGAGLVLGTDRRLGRIGIGLGLGGLFLVGVLVVAGRRRLAPAAIAVCLVAAALPAGLMIITAPTEPGPAVAAGTVPSVVAPTTVPAPPTSPPADSGSPLHGADSVRDELAPIDPGTPEKYGFGADQPKQMSRPLVGGVSDEPMTPARRDLLGTQLDQIRAATDRLGTLEQAKAAGYVKISDFVLGNGVHYVNYAEIDDTIDPNHPEMLTFAADLPDQRVIGVALYATGTEAAGPPTALPTEAIPWHFHYDFCYRDGIVIGTEDHPCEEEGGEVTAKYDGWMVDLWVVPGWDNPWGLISSKHPDLLSAYYCKLNGVDTDGKPLDP